MPESTKFETRNSKQCSNDRKSKSQIRGLRHSFGAFPVSGLPFVSCFEFRISNLPIQWILSILFRVRSGRRTAA